MAVAMKQKGLRSDSWNHRGFSPVRMSANLLYLNLLHSDSALLAKSTTASGQPALSDFNLRRCPNQQTTARRSSFNIMVQDGE
jgi:hypothetical protein